MIVVSDVLEERAIECVAQVSMYTSCESSYYSISGQ